VARLTRVAGRDRRYGGLADAEVMLALGGWGAVESWAGAQKIAAAQEMIRRRPDRRAVPAPGTAAAGPGALPVVWDKTLGEELALELSCSAYSGTALAELSCTLASRLPLTAAALETGVLDMSKVRLIAGETAVLSDEQARAAEAETAAGWDGLTWGELRDLITTAVINADPEGAARRREEASKDARYRFCLDRGALTATLAGYSLPPADAIRADQRVRARARGYRRHGIEGAFDQLCALAYLDLLTSRDARDRIPAGPVPGTDEDAEETAWTTRLAAGPDDDGGDADRAWDNGQVPDDPDDGAPDEDNPDQDAKADDDDDDEGDEGGQAGGGDGDGPEDGSPDGPDGGDGSGPDGSGPGGGPGPGGCGCGGGGGDGLAANVDLIIPLADLTGYAQRAAQARNLGGIDPDLARTLAAMAARDPASKFRIIITSPDGRATATGQATPTTPDPPATPDPPGRHTKGTPLPLPHPPPAGHPPDNPATPPASFTPAPGTSPDPAAGPDGYGQWRLRIGSTTYTVRLHPIPGPGPCTHHYQSTGYQPGPVLRRLTETRDGTCMLPCCNRNPRRCESEHAQPWPAGKTCTCNIGLNCKKHNLMKKDPRWQATQKPDGTRTWTTPARLRYTSEPRTYPT
jgi:hypothetical protein